LVKPLRFVDGNQERGPRAAALRALLVISLTASWLGSVTVSAAAAAGPDDVAGGAADSVIPGVVYIQSQLSDGTMVAGTGMVLTRRGEVLTNYHLVRDEVAVGVFDLGDHRIHTAHVVGADAAEDIAVVQIEGARNLPTVHAAHRAGYVGEDVVAIGNGGGRLGEHPGRITGTDRTLTAQDPPAGSETIHGMLRTDARLTPGDSGGPLVAAVGPDTGRVVGMDTAGLFVRHGERQTPIAGYAIPIAKALAVAARIVDASAGDRQSD
jgi:S1-C subfamily serine protease